MGLEQGVNLIVETPFVVAAVVGVFLNSVLPRERTGTRYIDGHKHPVIGEQEAQK
jgi:xanthine/uracil permease